jgi:hypothetical protein
MAAARPPSVHEKCPVSFTVSTPNLTEHLVHIDHPWCTGNFPNTKSHGLVGRPRSLPDLSVSMATTSFVVSVGRPSGRPRKYMQDWSGHRRKQVRRAGALSTFDMLGRAIQTIILLPPADSCIKIKPPTPRTGMRGRSGRAGTTRPQPTVLTRERREIVPF